MAVEQLKIIPTSDLGAPISDVFETQSIYFGKNNLARLLDSFTNQDSFYGKIIFDSEGNYWVCFSEDSTFPLPDRKIITHQLMTQEVNGDSSLSVNFRGMCGLNFKYNPKSKSGIFLSGTQMGTLFAPKPSSEVLTVFFNSQGFKETIHTLNDDRNTFEFTIPQPTV